MRTIYLIAFIFIMDGIYSRSIAKAGDNSDDYSVEFNKENDLENLTEHKKKMLLKKILIKNLESLYENGSNMDYETEYEPKDLKTREIAKRGFLSEHHKIKIYYDIVKLRDGTVILVPKDANKNHYFIG